MAVQPSILNEYKSVSQLENICNRLWELIYQQQNNLFQHENIVNEKQYSQSDMLKYSPFSSLPVILPSLFDR